MFRQIKNNWLTRFVNCKTNRLYPPNDITTTVGWAKRSVPTKNVLLCYALLIVCPTAPIFAKTWRTLTPGIEYRDFGATPLTPWAHIHAFRINLKQHSLDLVTTQSLGLQNASIDTLARKEKALITINGGFFDTRYRPLGLRIHQHNVYNPIKRVSWWGVFLIKQQQPSIISAREYQHDPNIEFAVQSGPRLIIDGHIPHLRPGVAERSALGITPQNQLIILVTENTLLTTTELAKLMRSPLMNCTNALNLDGGSSSQLVANIHSYHLNVYGFSKLSDAIIVK